MEQVQFTILENEALTRDVRRLTLAGSTAAIRRPGQFVSCRIPGFYLRRPISVCDWEDGRLTLIYKTVGQGTRALAQMAPGQTIDTLTGLGNGYDTEGSGPRPALLGGGVGVPPLYALCKALIREGKRPWVILGFNHKDEIFYEEEFRLLGAEVTVTTADGSYGEKGFVTGPLAAGAYTYFYACGPGPMLRAVESAAKTGGQFSFEERMGCGFGACMGCTCQTKNGPKRVCKEGPVFRREEIVWER